MVKLSLPPDDYSLLHRMSSQELRLPEQMVRWLIRQEAARRGLSSQENSKSATSKVIQSEQVNAFAGISTHS